jgi:peptidoglycan/LPS O-acetylase OafA/YrhL
MATATSKSSLIPALTGFRGIGAVWVVLYHLFPENLPVISLGYQGVDLFFILSGFVLTRVHWKDFDDGYSLSKYVRFLLLRLVRIYPLHITVLIVLAIAVFTLPGFTQRYEQPDHFGASQLIATALLVQNWRMGNVSLWNEPSWSLSAEWLAYIFFPLAILIASSIRWTLKPLFAIAAILAIYVICAAAGHPKLTEAGNVGLIRMAGEFFSGCVLCQFVMDTRSAGAPWGKVTLLSTLLLGFGLLSPSLPVLSYLGFAGLIASAAASNGAASTVMAAYPIVFLGEISFSLYLCHWPLIQVRNWMSDHVTMNTWWSSVALLPIIGTVSVLSWYYVERPSRAIGRKLIDLKWSLYRAPA